MISVIEQFLSLSTGDQLIYRLGRRLGILNLLRGIERPEKRERIQEVIDRNGIDEHNIDSICDELMKRFI